jgi:polysaccharide biosynthesis protein PslG
MVRDHGNTPPLSRTPTAPAVILTAAAIVVALVIVLHAAPSVRAATGVASGRAPASHPGLAATGATTRPSALTRCLRNARKAKTQRGRAAGRRACLRAAARAKRLSALTRCLRRARKAKTRRRRAAQRRACLRAAARPKPPTPLSPPPTPSLHPELFGVVTGGGFHNEDPATLGRDLDAFQQLHARWLRVDVNWAMIQAGGPGSYNWEPIDRIVQGATARSINVLASIDFTPAWARPAGTDATYGPDPTQYAEFAAAATRRYAAMGVHSYEVWNEPNNSGAWTPTPNPAAYTQVLRAAYPAIKGADPQATVLTGGTGPAPNDGTQIPPLDFLNAIYANGGGGSFDAVSHHPYTFPAYPGETQNWSPWYQMYGTSPSLRSLMIAHGDGAKKIWATEFGAPTSGPSGSYISEAVQASMVTRAISEWRTYPWAGPLFFFQGRDLYPNTDSRENFFGLLRYDFSPKPAYAAYQAAVSGG